MKLILTLFEQNALVFIVHVDTQMNFQFQNLT